MTTYYVKSGGGAAEYNAAHTYSIGDKMVPARSDVSSNVDRPRHWVWECTTGGTTNGAPTWPSGTITQDSTTVTQNAVVFTARKPGFSSGTTANWAFSTIYLDYLFRTTGNVLTSGDIVYVSNNHAESVTLGTWSLSGQIAGVSIICVSDSATPPTAVATTATCTANVTATDMAINTFVGMLYIYGITFIQSATGNMSLAASATHTIYKSCSFQLANASSASITANNAILLDCTFKFASTSQSINLVGARWSGGSVLSGGSAPSTLFGTSSAGYNVVENVDLSNLASTFNFFAATNTSIFFRIRNGLLPTSWTGVVGSNATHVYGENIIVDCFDSAGTNYKHLECCGYTGNIYNETTLVKSGGATDGVTPLSWKLVSGSTLGTGYPWGLMYSSEFAYRNTTTGSSKTVTVEFLHDSLTALKDNDIWLEVNYLGASGNPQGTMATNQVASVLTTAVAHASSSVTWTTTGMSNPNKQKLTVTFTPQLVGYFTARVVLAKSNYTVYVDPVMTVT